MATESPKKKSPVKRPPTFQNDREEQLFKKLEDISVDHGSKEYDKALRAISSLRLEVTQAESEGLDVKQLTTEIKRQE